jgi:hypothetical protein
MPGRKPKSKSKKRMRIGGILYHLIVLSDWPGREFLYKSRRGAGRLLGPATNGAISPGPWLEPQAPEARQPIGGDACRQHSTARSQRSGQLWIWKSMRPLPSCTVQAEIPISRALPPANRMMSASSRNKRSSAELTQSSAARPHQQTRMQVKRYRDKSWGYRGRTRPPSSRKRDASARQSKRSRLSASR